MVEKDENTISAGADDAGAPHVGTSDTDLVDDVSGTSEIADGQRVSNPRLSEERPGWFGKKGEDVC